MPRLGNFGLLLAAVASLACADSPRFLAPTQDIVLWPSTKAGCAKSPLQRLGANSPYFSGPNVFGISTDVPAQCVVDQAAYVLRHGSRYPDEGAYNGWKDFETRVSRALHIFVTSFSRASNSA
jgi:acid phosphatase